MRTRSGYRRAAEEAAEALRRSRRSWVSDLPVEIWCLVAEQIQGPKTLLSLVSTCRLLRDLLTPTLYSNRMIQITSLPLGKPNMEPLPTGIQHTRYFEVFIPEFMEANMDYDIEMNVEYAAHLTKMIKAMPNLSSFRWDDVAFESSYGPALILRDTEFLSSIKSRPLKHISIRFSHQSLEDHTDALNCYMPLHGFKGLTTLELFYFYAPKDVFIEDLVKVLTDCPQLKTLGLGLASEIDCEVLPEALILGDDTTLLFDLCTAYARHNKNRPLPLEVLRLGHGFWFGEALDPHVEKYLGKLCDISKLQTLHVFNGTIRVSEVDDEYYSIIRLDWSQLENCASLRQLSVSRLEKDVLRWLSCEGKCIEELIVTDPYQMYDEDLYGFDSMTLPNLTMLFTKEAFTKKRKRNMGSGSKGRKSNQNLYSSDVSLKAPGCVPVFKLDIASIIILDRLYDGGANLKRLGLCLDLKNQWARLAYHLPKLTQLTQLRISSKSYNSPLATLWRGITNPKASAHQYAQLAKLLCPSLQYIRIGGFAWQIMPDLPDYRDEASPRESSIQLRELEWEEVISIELFAMPSFAEDSGLPGREELRDRDYLFITPLGMPSLT